MTSQGRIEQAEIWKELLLKLPGIVSAEFVFGEEDSVRELHVLSTENERLNRLCGISNLQ